MACVLRRDTAALFLILLSYASPQGIRSALSLFGPLMPPWCEAMCLIAPLFCSLLMPIQESQKPGPWSVRETLKPLQFQKAVSLLKQATL